MADVQRYGSGGPYEESIGYSRVVRIAGPPDLVLVSGCTAVGEDGLIVGEGNPYLQTREALANVERALALAGCTLADVVRTRMFVVDITRGEEVGRAHGEVFRDIRPVASMVGTTGLLDPRLLVEIEAEAVAPAS